MGVLSRKPLRLYFGTGNIIVSACGGVNQLDGNVGLLRLYLTDNSHEVGDLVPTEESEKSETLVEMIFTKKESIQVLIRALDKIKDIPS
jgi:hypothetical protein